MPSPVTIGDVHAFETWISALVRHGDVRRKHRRGTLGRTRIRGSGRTARLQNMCRSNLLHSSTERTYDTDADDTPSARHGHERSGRTGKIAKCSPSALFAFQHKPTYCTLFPTLFCFLLQI